MQVTIGKKVKEMGNPHRRLEAYVSTIQDLSRTVGATPRVSYLKIAAERDGIPEDKNFVNVPLDELSEYIKGATVTGIEESVPGSFLVGSQLWRTEGEGLLVGLGFNVQLLADNLQAEDIRKVKASIESLATDYFIEFDNRRFAGKA